tara:strand:- start:47 stop:379 length:333 start_codon:yes stop_codon:yes gene_type:complete
MSSTTILPSHIAARSISQNEIVLPITEALEAINFLESKHVQILGWEGLVKTANGSIGHGNAPQGTASLEKVAAQAAAQICRNTMKEAHSLWMQENAGATDKLYFCITVRA